MGFGVGRGLEGGGGGGGGGGGVCLFFFFFFLSGYISGTNWYANACAVHLQTHIGFFFAGDGCILGTC